VTRSIFDLGELEFDSTHTVFDDGRALTFAGTMTNRGASRSPAIRSISPLSVALRLTREERIFAYSFSAGLSDTSYPPLDFGMAIKPHELVCWQANHGSSIFSQGGMTWGGASTARELPYQVVQVGGGGLFLGLEWPGDWLAMVSRAAGGAGLNCEMGLIDLDLCLDPGESIPLPGGLLGFYQGDWIEGCNALRRTIVDHYVPKLNGKAIVPPVFYDHWYALGQNCVEPLMREQSDVAARLGCEYFIQDAGWHKGSPQTQAEAPHFKGTGNWDSVEPTKYPNGLKPLSDHVAAQGMGFGLWIEPTRCDRDSDLAKQHPDWVLFAKDGAQYRNLVNFGNAEALAWFIETFDRLVRENNVRWFRFDIGAGIEDYPEPAGRKGILKFRHYEGLMQFWDHLLQEHPDLHIEGVSNGGRRMDLSCLKRCHTYWCDDHTQHPDVMRSGRRINLIFPGNYLDQVVFFDNEAADYPAYGYHALMGGSWGFTEKLSEWPEQRLRDAQRHVEVFKSFRHLLMKDFAPLFPYPYTLEDWDGWQWHDPETGEGVIIIFRCLGDEASCSPTLRWVDPYTRYAFTDPYTESRQVLTGAALSTTGFPVDLPHHRASMIRCYRLA